MKYCQRLLIRNCTTVESGKGLYARQKGKWILPPIEAENIFRFVINL